MTCSCPIEGLGHPKERVQCSFGPLPSVANARMKDARMTDPFRMQLEPVAIPVRMRKKSGYGTLLNHRR
jgi:hypothetical protein